jgi:excisionase family DNA binding protein
MTRLEAAVAELVAALREEAERARPPVSTDPPRLLSILEAAERVGVGRSTLYAEMGAGRLRSVKVGRRRLIPADALRSLVER